MSYIGETTTATPIDKFLSWKGKPGKAGFFLWNKETETLEDFDLKDFIIVKQGFSVGGFDKKNESGIWSNEIDNISSERLFVYRDNNLIHQGLYNDIKDELINGCKLQKCLTVQIGNNLVHFKLFGSASFLFSDLIKGLDLEKQKFKLDKLERALDIDGKPTGIPAMIPLFCMGGEVTELELGLAHDSANKLKDYYEEKKKSYESAGEESEMTSEVKEKAISNGLDDDLPF